ncbi:MAG: DNA-methyltransferase [Thermoguttaceae bacterium]
MSVTMTKLRAPRNRTICVGESERKRLQRRLLKFGPKPFLLEEVLGRTICGDSCLSLAQLPSCCCDLIFADPPYNLSKEFNGMRFKERSNREYADWLRKWLPEMKRLLKPSGAIYVCGDWRSSGELQRVLEESFIVQNRITWEREKGRGAKRNWKNSSEDIWFATVSEQFTFHVDRVKLRRKVIAPYRDEIGNAKDWNETESGRFRLTHPSNLWTDISVPFWSMPENTDHPTQKPEKLLAKIILASTEPGDVVFDPFLGSGTTSVVAKKLERQFFGIELDEEYACLVEKRLELAGYNSNIQGYSGGVFWERNSLGEQQRDSTTIQRSKKIRAGRTPLETLFD